jgi:ribosomal protein S18 acetylase RimI-like enzyme
MSHSFQGTYAAMLTIEDYDQDDSWFLALERSSFNESDAMDEMELAEFKADPSNHILLLKYQDIKVGSIVLSYSPNEVYLESFAILPDYRSKSLGGKYLAMLLDRLKRESIPKITAHVRNDNPAKRVYEKQGFSLVNRVPGFYNDGEDALFLVHEFAPN